MIRLKKSVSNIDYESVFNDSMNKLISDKEIKNKIYDLSYEFAQLEDYSNPNNKLIIGDYYNKFIKFCNTNPDTIIEIIWDNLQKFISNEYIYEDDFINLNNNVKLIKINELLSKNSNIIKLSIKDYFFK